MKFFKFVILCFLVAMYSCVGNNTGVCNRDLPEIEKNGKLVVLTLEGSTSYFVDDNQSKGFQYDLSKMLAEDLNLEVEVKLAPNFMELSKMLMHGDGDLIAFRYPEFNSAKENMLFMTDDFNTFTVLVQSVSDTMITSAEQLYAKEVHVPRNSKYALCLQNINDELGGIIKIVLEDTLSTDKLIEKVARHEISYTVTDKEIAMLNKTYFRNIDHSLQIGISQHCSWTVRKTSPLLYKKVDDWLKNIKNDKRFIALYKKYFVNKNYLLSHNVHPYFSDKGTSPYDDLFKKYAKDINWDWRLLMAVSFQESKFDPTAESGSGAKGLMQLTVPTAKRMGLEESHIFDPDKNIKAGARNIEEMQRIFKNIQDKEERTKFVLAAYNSGVAHIFDARAMAQKAGKNRDKWEDVAPYMILKSDSTVFSDTTMCKYGYSRGNETVTFVHEVLRHYEEYKKRTK